MNVRFVSVDMEWTDAMKSSIRAKIVEPLARKLKSTKFELSVHFQSSRNHKISPNGEITFEMWIVLQTFDGRHNEVVRRQGTDFYLIADEVSHNMRRIAPRLNTGHSHH